MATVMDLVLGVHKRTHARVDDFRYNLIIKVCERYSLRSLMLLQIGMYLKNSGNKHKKGFLHDFWERKNIFESELVFNFLHMTSRVQP